MNGRIQDIKDAYSLIRDLYEQAWLRSNRPYALRPVLEHYDYTIGIWLGRSDRMRSVKRQWSDSHTLPAASEVGIPMPPAGAHRWSEDADGAAAGDGHRGDRVPGGAG